MSSSNVAIDAITAEVAKLFISEHKLNRCNVSQRAIRNVIRIAENNPNVTLKDVLKVATTWLNKNKTSIQSLVLGVYVCRFLHGLFPSD